MKRILRSAAAVIAVLAIAWELYSPIVVLKQQGQISATADAIKSVQGTNKGLLKRLAKDEHTVVVYAGYISGTLNWETNIVAPLCAVSVTHSCPPPPSPPKG